MSLESQLAKSPAQIKLESKKISAQAKKTKSKFAKLSEASKSTSDITGLL